MKRIDNIMFTVGMATYDDFDGVYFTVQALRLYSDRNLIREIIVVDNNPEGPYAKHLQSFCLSVGVNYVPFPTPKGTAAPRNEVFKRSTSDYTICMDSHIMLVPGALNSLAAYLQSFHSEYKRPCEHLLQGPMWYDWLNQGETHFNDEWRGEMWGTWGFNEEAMRAGYAFDIPAMGLGVFAAHTKSWLGFNPLFRGFGGEEWYIHIKYRQAQRRTLCIPQFGWIHRFARPAYEIQGRPAPYRVDKWDKVRNYIIGHKELGLNLDNIKRHFCSDAVRFPSNFFDALVANPETPHPTNYGPITPQQAAAVGGCSGCGTAAPAPVTHAIPQQDVPRPQITIEAWYEAQRISASDIQAHIPKLREYAAKCESVVEFGTRRGVSTVALLAAQPKRLDCYDTVRHPEVNLLEKLKGNTEFTFHTQDTIADGFLIDHCDMLFIDTIHTEKQVAAELARHADMVRKYLVFHDTHTFGEVGEDSGKGILWAIRAYLQTEKGKQWTVIHASAESNGLLILSRLDEDKTKPPGMLKKAWNYTNALAAHAAKGFPVATEETIQKRIELCTLCPARTDDVCGVCGCPVADKAALGGSECPLKKW